MTPHELREVAAGCFLLPSPCLAPPVVGSQIILPSTEHNPVNVDLYGDALMNLPAPGDAHWRVHHDAIADAFRDHCVHDLGVAGRQEVDDLFQQAVPLDNTVPRDELKDLVPDAELSLPAFNVVTGRYDPRSLKSTLLEFKTMRYGNYTAVPRATDVDRFERSLLGDIQRAVAARDAAWHNTEPGQKGPLRDILDMSEYTGMVFGTVGATDRSHTSLPKSARSAGATTNTGGKKQPTVSAVAIRRAICSAASKRELVARSGAPAPHTSAENTNCADVGRPLFAASESGLAPGSDASQRSVAAASALAKVKRAASRASSSRSLMDSTTSPGGSERGSMRASEGADGSSRSSGNAAKKATARHNRNSMPEQLQRHQAGDGDDDGDAAPPAQSQSALAHGSASPAAASSAVDDRGQPLLAEQRDIGAATAEKTAGVDRWEDREDDLVLELTPRGSADGVAIVPASSEEERPWGPRRSDGADSLGHHAIAQLISGDDPRVATATAVVAAATVAVPTVDEDEDSKMMVEMLRELMGTELTGVRAAPGVDPRVGQRVAAESPRAPPSAELPISSLLLGIGRDGLDLGPAHLPAHLPPHLPAHLPRPPASPPNPASPSPRSLPLSGGLLGTPSSRTASRHPPPAYDPFTRQQSTASVATAADGAAAGHAAGAGRAHNTGAREAQPDRAEGHTVTAKRGGSLPAHSPPVRQPAAAQPEKDSASAEAAAQGNAGGGSRLVRNSQDRSWHLERLGTPQGGGPAGPEGTSPRARRARRQSAIIPVDDMHLPGTIAQSSSLGRTVYPVASTAHPFGS
eukprot:jgi/Tetstr1/459064/TSEL_000400.t1